jgi:hypothetical protein
MLLVLNSGELFTGVLLLRYLLLGDSSENLSDKTLKILARPGRIIGKHSDIKSVETLPNGLEFSVPFGTNQADLEYVRNDFNNVDDKIVKQERISFIWQMALFWAVPCFAVYALGLSLLWVYRGFRGGPR